MLGFLGKKASDKVVYLHIGFEKTGSTSIQKYFGTHADVLETRGVLYFSDKSSPIVYDETHWPLAAMLAKNNKFVPPSKHLSIEAATRTAQEIISRTESRKIVFSAEPFSSMLLEKSQIAPLKKIFKGYTVKVVAYVRRQDNFFLSHISNYVKGGLVLTMSQAITMEGTNIHYGNPDRYDYDAILSRWAAVFGKDNVIVRPFEPSVLHGKDVVLDFLDVLGVDADGLPKPIRANERLAVDTMLFLNLINAGALPALKKGFRSKVLNCLAEYPTRRPGQQLISNELRMEIISSYKTSNDAVVRKYLKGEGPLFRDLLPDSAAPWKPISQLSPREILEQVCYLHDKLPELTDRIIESITRPAQTMGPKYLVAQRWLLPAYVELMKGRFFPASSDSSDFSGRPSIARLPRAAGRRFTPSASPKVFDDIQRGTLQTKYRGVTCYMSPLDMGLYTNLMGKFVPKTVIEIGSGSGGSALWFADLLSNHQVENPRVISIDVNIQADFEDERISFIQGDANELGLALTDALLAQLPHPYLVIEDSSHYYTETSSVLEFFRDRLQPGDYLVVEGGCLSHFTDPAYDLYEDGPNRAVADFMLNNPGVFEVDAELCDFYGYNMTYSLNG